MPNPSDISSSDILIIGAGVLGLCTAVELTRRGRDVRVVDAGGVNASSVAAGMIAPAMEAVLDRATPERAALMHGAREAWDAFAPASGIALHPAETLWVGLQATAMQQALEELGFAVGEAAEDGRLSIPSDVLVEPEPALAAMRAALRHPVVTAKVEAVARTAAGWRIAAGDGALEGRVLILAIGAAAAIPGLPSSVAQLIERVTPIRGQIGRVRMSAEAVTRGLGVYVAPSGDGALVGATMEPGRRDLEPDVEAGEQLVQAAEQLLGRFVEGPVEWRVGVRGATPDGLPMAGRSGEANLFLALAPRRNGWLLGPMVARVVAEAVERGANEDGGAGSPHAAALDPRRFTASV